MSTLRWTGGLSLLLAVWVAEACAEEYRWQPATPRPTEPLLPAVSLGRPVAAQQPPAPAWNCPDQRNPAVSPCTATLLPPQPAVADAVLPVVQTANVTLAAPSAIIRAQAPDPVAIGSPPPPSPVGTIPAPPPGAAVGGPPPGAAVIGPPPGVPAVPVSPQERFNCGVVLENPDSGHALVPGAPAGHHWFQGTRNWFGGLFAGGATAGRTLFQSDHGFDVFSSPVSNPFLFEDPRSLTEIKPIFIYQGTPTSNPVFRGGDIEYFGLQGRVAFTERLSLVVSEFGLIWMEPHNSGGDFASHDGVSELRVGPQYTFYRCEQTGTIAAAGLLLDIPWGPHKVLQDTGSLSLEPYVSVGQNFLKSAYGSANFLGTLGYSVGADNKRSDFLWTSVHFDYDVGNLHKIYPLLELNYFHYTSSGTAHALDFEGRDLFNFGSTAISGHDDLSMAVGARYKFTERLQAGAAYEFPLSGRRDLLDFRFTFDVIFRF